MLSHSMIPESITIILNSLFHFFNRSLLINKHWHVSHIHHFVVHIFIHISFFFLCLLNFTSHHFITHLSLFSFPHHISFPHFILPFINTIHVSPSTELDHFIPFFQNTFFTFGAKYTPYSSCAASTETIHLSISD